MSQPQNYSQADALLQGRCKNSRKLENNTYLKRRGSQIAVRLHSTDIITYSPDNSCTLSTGGWQTITTKDRINKYCPAWIWQENSVWYVSQSSPYGHDNTARYLYVNGIKINFDGHPVGSRYETKEDRKAVVDLKTRIKKFAKLCSDNCIGVKPEVGDCFFCRADFGGTDHLDSHMSEGYPVISLIYNACKRFGASQATMSALYHGEEQFADHAKRTVKTVVRRYMLEQFGLANQ